MFKKILAAVLALVMVFGVSSVCAFAADDVVYGDVTNDKNINSQDALKVLQISTGMSTSTFYLDALADVNADSKVNSSDALLILQYSTGLVTNFNKSYDKTVKATKIDPVIAHGQYTYTFPMQDESLGDVDVVCSTDGKSMVIATPLKYSVISFELRFLYKDGKNYGVVSTGYAEIGGIKTEAFKGMYGEVDEDTVTNLFKSYEAVFKADTIYSSTAKKTVDGKTYDCEAFVTESGIKYEYCYLNSEIQMLIITNGDAVQTRAISNLKMGADTERLDIPSDYTRDDSFFADLV